MEEFKISYVKHKSDVLKTLENSNNLKICNTQNYIPLYDKFFVLNETNWNTINLETHKSITTCNNRYEFNKLNCEIYDSLTKQKKLANVFVKFSPLLDPIKYLMGKYDHTDTNLFNLPKINNESNSHSKVISPYNSAYTDSFFSFLTSKLLNEKKFIHGLEFYGSYLCNQQDYRVNILDDIEYIAESSFFNKQKEKLFKIDDEYYDVICDDNSKNKKKRLQFGDTIKLYDVENIYDILPNNIENEPSVVTLDKINISSKSSTGSISSTCSSRSSHTTNDEESNSDDTLDSETIDNDNIFTYIDNFPVNMICLEMCKQTLDDYAFSDEDDETGQDVEPEEWLAILAQVIMQLIVYQKVFSFTHNDLHTNNIMYNDTEKKFIYYCYNNNYYKIPTYGKIWKIIDFGRAIYKVNGKIICSDSFSPGEDADTQYNCEPFMNPNNPRLDPNFSFDLSRLGCSLFNYFFDDIEWLDNLNELDDVQKLILDWCTDDKGKNILYKKNGTERYPEFKLYKMIARNVHNHTPEAQLERECFSNFKISKNKIKKNIYINIDTMPVCN